MSINSPIVEVSQHNSTDDLFDSSGVVQMQFGQYLGTSGNRRIVKDLVTIGRLGVVPFVLRDGERKPIMPWSTEQVGGYEVDLTLLESDDFDLERLHADIHKFFDRPMGIYILTGERSGDLEAIDFDWESAEHIRRFKVDVGDDLFGKLVVVSTAKGFHVLYRSSGIEPNQVLAYRADPEVEDNPILIETRGCSGLLQSAGTPAELHPSGREYRVVQGSLLAIPTISPEDRGKIIAKCRSYARWTPPPKPPRVKRNDAYEGDDPADVRPGTLFNRRADWSSDVLEPAGYTEATESSWWRPGKVGGSTSVKLVPGSDLLHVFSSSVRGLTPNETYTKFGAYVALHHDGDFRAAAKALASAGYRDRSSITVARPTPQDLEGDDIAGVVLAEFMPGNDPQDRITTMFGTQDASTPEVRDAESDDDVQVVVERDDEDDLSQLAADLPACDERQQPPEPVVAQGRAELGVPLMPVLRPIPSHVRLPEAAKPVRFVRARDCRTLTPKPWIVKDFLLDKDVSVTFGPSGAMKSFLMLELSFCIAGGIPYCGKYPVREGYACYGYTEALEGSHQRLDALLRKYKLDDVPEKLLIWPDKVELTGEAGVGPLIAGIHQCVPERPRIVVIDTLSANFGAGDENGPDMTTAVRQVTMIREEFKCHANCVHHTGKVLGMKERGHSSLGANVDARMEVSRNEESGVVSVRNLKTKDRRAGSEWAYRATVHELWTEHDDVMGDDVISSITLDPINVAEVARTSKAEADDEWMKRTVRLLRIIADEPKGSTDWRRVSRVDNNKWSKILDELGGGDKGKALAVREGPGHGKWALTDKGREYLATWGGKVKG